jgi:hypothetical protein
MKTKTSATLRAVAVGVALGLAPAVCAPARAQEKATPTPARTAATAEEREAAYAQAIEKRTQDILAVLGLDDPARTARVHDALITQYRALRDWHDAHDDQLKQLGEQSRKAAGEEARAIAEQIDQVKASLKTLHDRFLAGLSEQLTPEQVDRVKDCMTYNKVRVTYGAYCEIVPDLNEREKARILELLKDAREEAMDGGSAEEKSAVFKKYKGKIVNYLTAQGHDVARAYREWGEKQKAKAGAKNSPPPARFD